MTYFGIDYSMTCPCLCILGKDFDDSVFFFMVDKLRYTGFRNGNIVGLEYPSWTTPESRYDALSSRFIDIILKVPVVGPFEKTVMIEDYSMGSRGRVFHIAENCGLLKYKLYKNNIVFSTVAPSAVKKFATGKGNADKQKMYDTFVEKEGIDLKKRLGLRDQALSNPLTDIVDAYYIAKYAKEKDNE